MNKLSLAKLPVNSITRRMVSSEAYKALPEESKKIFDRMIRVDHAEFKHKTPILIKLLSENVKLCVKKGEFGAIRIYAGQMAVLGKTSAAPTIHEMWEQEKVHLAKFEELIPKYRVRPSLLLPIWNAAGYALGAGTALLGKEAAMACTVAVESVITDHYNNQLRELLEANPEKHAELLEVIKKFRDDEQEHHDTGLKNDAEKAVFYTALTEAIKIGCRAAVWMAERV